MNTARALLTAAVAVSLLAPGCGKPPHAAPKVVKAQSDVVPDGCIDYGFVKSYLYPPEGDSRCTATSPNDKQLAVQMSIFFLCDRDPSGWPTQLTYQYSWFQCLGGGAWTGDPQPILNTMLDCPSTFGEPEGPCQMQTLPDDPLDIDGSTPTGQLLRALTLQINNTRAKIKAEGGSSTQAERLMLVDAAQLFADLSDQAFYRGWQALGMHTVGTGWRVLDMAVNFAPGAALVRDSIIVLTGTNPITGEQVTDTERAMIAGTLLVPAFLEGAAHTLVDLGETLEDVARSGKAEATAAEDLIGAIERSDEEVADLVHTSPCGLSRIGRQSVAPLAGTPCGPLGTLTSTLTKEAEDTLSSLRSGDVSFGTAKTDDFRRAFFDNYGWELEKDVGQVHHAVEQQVLDKWPGVITAEEMDSLENLRGIPIGPDGYELHQSDIRRYWNGFYQGYIDSGTTPTKEELLSMAKQIDDMFGADFIPPIR